MTREIWEFDAKLVRAIDGDTYVFSMDVGFDIHPHEAVRIIGINAPEVTGDTEVEGNLAKDYAQDFLANAEHILVKTIKNRNGNQTRTFTRYIGHVIVDGVDFAEHLVALGFAVRV